MLNIMIIPNLFLKNLEKFAKKKKTNKLLF